MIKKQKVVDDIYKNFDKNDRNMSEVDKTKFLSIVKEIFETDEKSLKPIRESATLYGKISSKIYFFGVLGCAILSIIFSSISLYFKSLQAISFLFLLLFYSCFFMYHFYDSLSYKSEIDFSIFSIEPYFYELKSLSDIFLPKLMELSEKTLEAGLLGLKDSHSDLSRTVLSIINIFRSAISLPGMIASSLIFFEINLNPWVVVIAYGNMIVLLLKVIKYGRLHFFVIYDYAIAMTEVALRLKSDKNSWSG